MNKRIYKNIMNSINMNLNAVRMIYIINKISTIFVYCIYPISLIMLAYNRDIRFWKAFTIPAISFVLVSIFREYTNFPRPYEVFDIAPVLKKDTKGKSFPSRHVFSVFVIAMTLYYISNTIGILLMFIGLILGIVRVVGGVHFPRDVIIGAIIGVLCSGIGWNLFPF